jgi:hypothetical protein
LADSAFDVEHVEQHFSRDAPDFVSMSATS